MFPRPANLLGLFLISLLALCLSGCPSRQPDDHPTNPPPLLTPTDSPTPDGTPVLQPNDHRQRRLQVIEQVLQAKAESFPGSAGIVFYELDLGARLQAGTSQPFEAASLIKLPIMIELYRQLEGGGLEADEEMVFEEKFIVGGSGILKDQPPGGSYKLTELARLMIQESDNVATDMLIERLGMEAINHLCELKGYSDTRVQRKIYDFAEIERGRDNITSAQDVCKMLEEIANGQLPGATKMHQLLEGQKRRDILAAPLPEGTRVANKTGSLLGILHDAGIIYAPHGAYILVCMGQEIDDPDEAKKTWVELSDEVYKIYAEPVETATPSEEETPSQR